MGKRVGGEVDGYCTKCRMVLAHTIVAMVGEKIARARCNTCMGQHAFRAHPPGTARAATPGAGPARRSTRAPKEAVETLPFEAIFEGTDLARARKYSPRERFEGGDVLEHPTFGMGLVENARHDKVDVVFRAGRKTLVHAAKAPSKEGALRANLG